jgi:DNA polymerase-1
MTVISSRPSVIVSDFEKLGPMAALDTETAMAPAAFKGRGHVRLIQFHSHTHSFWYDLAQFGESDWAELAFHLRRPGQTWIMQNAAFDIRVLQGCGINLKGQIHDTMLLSWLLNNGIPNVSNSLEAIARRELDIKLDKSAQKSDWMNVELTPELLEYGMNDVKVTFDAYHKLYGKVLEQGLDIAYEIEIKALLPTIEMESTGLHLSRELIDDYAAEQIETRDTSLAAFLETLDGALQDAGREGLPRLESGEFNLNKTTRGSIRLGTKVFAGFNTGSWQQVLKYFNAIGVEPFDAATGKPSVDKKALAAWKHVPAVDIYLTWKRADKHLQMCKTLVDAQQEDGRIYARFNQTGTFTGRYSSSGPNLQNIPRGAVRYAFTAPEGRALVDLDYSGMELRALCSSRIADEPAMRDAFNSGADVHATTAALMFGVPVEQVTDEQRRLAKGSNFGLAYGSGPQGLVNYFNAIGIQISLSQGEDFRNAWLKAYPNIAKWHNTCKALVESGQPVFMVDGRRRFLQGETAKHTVFANSTVQGSSASAMKLALAAIHKRKRKIDPTAKLVACVHDEIIIECDADKADDILAMAKASMIEAGQEIFGNDITLDADGGVGDSWGSAKA